MSDQTEFWAIVADVCTRRELEALQHKAAGFGVRRSARILGISTSAVRDRLDSAERKIRAERERRQAA